MHLLSGIMHVYDQRPGSLYYGNIGINGSMFANVMLEIILDTDWNVDVIRVFFMRMPEWLAYLLIRRLLEKCSKHVYSSLQPAIAVLRDLIAMKQTYPSPEEKKNMILSHILKSSGVQPTDATKDDLPGTSRNQKGLITELEKLSLIQTPGSQGKKNQEKYDVQQKRKRKSPTKKIIPSHILPVLPVLIVEFIFAHLRFSKSVKRDLLRVKNDQRKKPPKMVVPVNFKRDDEDIKELQLLNDKYKEETNLFEPFATILYLYARNECKSSM